jgi:hypothetical protein
MNTTRKTIMICKTQQKLENNNKKMMILQAKHNDNKGKGTENHGWQQRTRLTLMRINSYKDKLRRDTRKMSCRNKNTKPKMLEAWSFLRFLGYMH